GLLDPDLERRPVQFSDLVRQSTEGHLERAGFDLVVDGPESQRVLFFSRGQRRAGGGQDRGGRASGGGGGGDVAGRGEQNDAEKADDNETEQEDLDPRSRRGPSSGLRVNRARSFGDFGRNRVHGIPAAPVYLANDGQSRIIALPRSTIRRTTLARARRRSFSRPPFSCGARRARGPRGPRGLP